MNTREIEYSCDDVALRGMAVLPEGGGKRPGVLVAHDWAGRGERAIENAQRVAALGYVGFALDMYGGARVGRNTVDNARLMRPLQSDRALLMRRMNAALDALKELPEVDASQTGAIGFCFGGMCVLDLARSGANVGGVVSFHGLFAPPPPELTQPIRAQVLALHGYKDPMVPPDHVVALGKELTDAGVDWQLHAYGTAVHAFTNRQATAPTTAMFEPRANDRAWRSMRDFFADLFGA